jgi:CHASE2 domain-containing sensor protein
MRLRPPLAVSKDIAIIEIYDDTLRNLGKWPLPRDFHASLIKVLKEYQVRAIVFDILFSEPTLYDEVLANALKDAGCVYLAQAFYFPETNTGPFPESKNILAGITAGLEKYARGRGHINTLVDSDGKVRRIPLFIKYNGRLIPNLAVKAACDWLGLDLNQVKIQKDGVGIDQRLFLPNSRHSAFLVNYPGKWENSFARFQYFDILKAYSDVAKGAVPKLDLSSLKNKICFIGLTATGTSDLRAVPIEKIYPMLGLQASVFNSLIQGQFLKDIGPVLNTLINIIIFCLSLFVCLKFPPFKALLASAVLGTGYFFVSLAIFIFFGLWVDLFLPLVIIAINYVGVVLYKFIEETHKRELLEQELDIAHEIQESFLPAQITDLPGIEISSFMQPAKFVAGDLYDIIQLDEKRLGVLIGDVAGKGVSASLIMAKTITFARIYSRKFLNTPFVLDYLNKELYGQFQGRFVTALYMIIDPEKKRLTVSSAGHSPLLIYNPGTNQVREVELSGGLPLGIMDNTEYQEVSVTLEPLDKIVVFSDGVSEARNKKGAEFGVENVKNLLTKSAGLSAAHTLEQVKAELARFCLHCPQHDDITLIIASLLEK